jgi:hypothetical protein
VSWIQTYTNLEFRYDDINPDCICLEDIARALAAQTRFLGHTSRRYSGAEHSYRVSERAWDLAVERNLSWSDVFMCARWGHLHDSSEAYVGDLPTPLKHLPFMAGYVKLENKILAVIKKKFGIVTTPEIEAIVKQADLELLNTERLQLMGPPPADWIPLPTPLNIRIDCWDMIKAEKIWLGRWEDLM